MKLLITSLFLLFFLPVLQAQFGLPSGGGNGSVRATLVSEMNSAAPGQAFRVAVKLEHEPHWHTYGKVLPEDVVGKPTVLKWTLPDGWKVADLPWPDAKTVESTDGAKSVGYEGTVYLPASITPSGKTGDKAEISVLVDALACDPKSCVPVKPTAKLVITLGEKAEANASHG